MAFHTNRVVKGHTALFVQKNFQDLVGQSLFRGCFAYGGPSDMKGIRLLREEQSCQIPSLIRGARSGLGVLEVKRSEIRLFARCSTRPGISTGKVPHN